MPLRHPEPGNFEHLLQEVRVGAASLLRLSKHPKTEPWWSRGIYRFDGPALRGFGTCYATDSLSVAFAESVIHDDAWFRNGHHEVPAEALKARHLVHLGRPSKPDLLLADLTGTALKTLGLNNDISAGSDYAISMAWALAIHECNAKWDGIRYVSRQRNDRFAVALFERSRVVRTRTRKLAGKTLDALCDEYRVLAI